MPVSTAAVGQRLKPWSGRVDARWLVGYVAGIGRTDPELFDTSRQGGVVAHPVFPVAPEWQLLTDPDSGFELGLSPQEAYRGVHASNDGLLHRPIPQDVDVTVEAEVTGVQATAAGALVTVRFDGTETGGAPLWTTWMRSMFRGVATTGPDAETAPAPALPPLPPLDEPVATVPVVLTAVAGQVYNECARVFNPIHSDTAIARAAGLDRPILHGSATFATAVSCVLDRLKASSADVSRCGVEFRAMVPFPAAITVELYDTLDGLTPFQVRNGAGEIALRRGFVVTR